MIKTPLGIYFKDLMAARLLRKVLPGISRGINDVIARRRLTLRNPFQWSQPVFGNEMPKGIEFVCTQIYCLPGRCQNRHETGHIR